MSLRFLRLPQVIEHRACSRPTLYRDIAAGVFPAPLHRGRVSLWIESEVDSVLAAEAAGASPEELRALVRGLVGQRGASVVDCPPRDRRSGQFVSPERVI